MRFPIYSRATGQELWCGKMLSPFIVLCLSGLSTEMPGPPAGVRMAASSWALVQQHVRLHFALDYFLKMQRREKKKDKVNKNVEHKRCTEEKQGFSCRQRRLLTLNEALSRPVCFLGSHRRGYLCFTHKRCLRSDDIGNAPCCKNPRVRNMSPSVTTRY